MLHLLIGIQSVGADELVSSKPLKCLFCVHPGASAAAVSFRLALGFAPVGLNYWGDTDKTSKNGACISTFTFL